MAPDRGLSDKKQLGVKGKKNMMPSPQMPMGPRNFQLSLLAKQHSHECSTRRQVDSLGFIIETMQKHG
jgi:hypothetical protein